MKVVLHICCGICAAGVVDKLVQEGHQVHGFFCNPNIHPSEEYKRRLEAAYKVAKELNFPLEEAPYSPKEWLKETLSLRHEPEGRKRCEVCFRFRLKKTCLYMLNCGGDVFTTTLTISPHKSAETVNRIGREIGGESFLTRDFKKGEGFKRAIKLAKEWSLYRQDYCGCIYSLKGKRKAIHQLSEG